MMMTSAKQQTTLGIEPEQSAFDIPLPLTEKYRPAEIDGFLNCIDAKATVKDLLARPRFGALFFVGPPGTGKTSMGLALARELGAGLIHVASQSLKVATVESLWEKVQYYPGTRSPWWIVLCDEIDTGSREAQIALLSKLDSTAALRPTFGGGCEQGKLPNVIFVFTSNGGGEDGTRPPANLEPRFLSRCKRLPFRAVREGLAEYLSDIWRAEANGAAEPDFQAIADEAAGNVRDALQSLEIALTRAASEPALKVEARVHAVRSDLRTDRERIESATRRAEPVCTRVQKTEPKAEPEPAAAPSGAFPCLYKDGGTCFHITCSKAAAKRMKYGRA